MGTLKSTLKIESTDLFPTPVSFTVVNNNTVAGDVAGFNNVVLGVSNSLLNLATIDGTGAYLYAQAPSTNTGIVSIGYTGQAAVNSATGTFVRLSPGDVAFLPVGATSTGCPNIIAFASTASQQLNFFLGEK